MKKEEEKSSNTTTNREIEIVLVAFSVFTIGSIKGKEKAYIKKEKGARRLLTFCVLSDTENSITCGFVIVWLRNAINVRTKGQLAK